MLFGIIQEVNNEFIQHSSNFGVNEYIKRDFAHKMAEFLMDKIQLNKTDDIETDRTIYRIQALLISKKDAYDFLHLLGGLDNDFERSYITAKFTQLINKKEI